MRYLALVIALLLLAGCALQSTAPNRENQVPALLSSSPPMTGPGAQAHPTVRNAYVQINGDTYTIDLPSGAPDGVKAVATAEGIVWVGPQGQTGEDLGKHPTEPAKLYLSAFQKGGGDLSRGAQELVTFPLTIPYTDSESRPNQYVTVAQIAPAGDWVAIMLYLHVPGWNQGVGRLDAVNVKTREHRVITDARFAGGMHFNWRAEPGRIFWEQQTLTSTGDVKVSASKVMDLDTGRVRDVPPGGASPESTADDTPQDPRARLTRGIPVELAPNLRATVHTLPEGEQPLQGGPLLVTGEDGRVLLERTTGVLAFVGVRQVGTSLALLVVEIEGGGSMGSYYEAYVYDSAQAQLVRVPWDKQTFAISTSGVEQAGDLLRTTGRSEAAVGRRMVTILWQYRGGTLQRVRTEFTPPPYPKDELDVLLLAFDTVAKRLPDETPRYFADPEQARRFYADLVDQIPQDGFPFCAECSYQRLPAQGPVFIWTPDARINLPASRLFAVAPGFRTGPVGPQITDLTETPVTLRVPDAAAALQVLHEQPELRQRSIPEPVFQGGFWAVQVSGAGVWRTNPRTGEVQHSQ